MRLSDLYGESDYVINFSAGGGYKDKRTRFESQWNARKGRNLRLENFLETWPSKKLLTVIGKNFSEARDMKCVTYINLYIILQH